MTSFEDILVEGLGKSFDRRPKIDEPKPALEPLNPIGRVTPEGLMAQKGATIHEGCREGTGDSDEGEQPVVYEVSARIHSITL